MNEILQPTTRRALLQKGLACVGGAIAVPLTVPEARSEPPPPTPAAAPPVSGPDTINFYARRLLVHCPGRNAGELSAGSGRLHTHADLLDRPNGAKVGEFSAMCLGPESPFGRTGSDHAVEFQTLKLAEGTLFGIGNAGPAAEGERAHAILGGTGRFAGAKGCYVIRQSPTGRGGEDVEFRITLLS